MHVSSTGCVIVHADARAARTKRECILLYGAWPVACVAYAIYTSGLVLARLLLLYLDDHDLLLVQTNLTVSALMELVRLHRLRTLLLRSTPLHHQRTSIVLRE